MRYEENKKIKKENKVNFEKTSRSDKIISLISLLISFISLIIAYLVRQDTAELTKFTDKPVYYTISLYPKEDSQETAIYDKYMLADLKLVVDAFELKKEGYLDINYNAVFTKTKYYFVYDYDLDKKDYKYMRYTLDDKTTAKLRLEDDLYAAPTKLYYSFTPNKEYCYILIYTETTTEKNLDLIFFKYKDKGDTLALDTIEEDGEIKIDIERIDYDTVICKDYFIDLWSENNNKKKEDIEYMIEVYSVLRDKLIY